jgi:predicted ATPase
MEAAPGAIFCDRTVYEGARNQIEFISQPSLNLKGIAEPVEVFSPSGKKVNPNQVETFEWMADRPLREAMKYQLNQLPPASMQALKVASVIGTLFSLKLLQDIYPDKTDRQYLAKYLESPQQAGLIIPLASIKEPGYAFRDALTQETAYDLMLFSQRRQIHRAIAKWLEQKHGDNLSPHLAVLSHHWARAEDTARAIEYMEQAGEESRRSGDIEGARSFIEEALALEKNSAVLGKQYRDSDPDQK